MKVAPNGATTAFIHDGGFLVNQRMGNALPGLRISPDRLVSAALSEEFLRLAFAKGLRSWAVGGLKYPLLAIGHLHLKLGMQPSRPVMVIA